VNASAIQILKSEISLRFDMTTLGRAGKPMNRCLIVPGDAYAAGVTLPQSKLRLGIWPHGHAAFGQAAQFIDRKRPIALLGHSTT
jgi:hypothetical protein